MHMKVSLKVLDTQRAVHRVSVSQGDICRDVLSESCVRVEARCGLITRLNTQTKYSDILRGFADS